MGLRIIYGRAGSGKSEYCYKEIAKDIEKNEKNIFNNTRAIFIYSRKKTNGSSQDRSGITGRSSTFK